MRTIHILAPLALALALAACTDAPDPNAPPAEIVPPAEVAAQADKPRLTVPTESVGKDYKPAEIKLHAPAENGKPRNGSEPADDAKQTP